MVNIIDVQLCIVNCSKVKWGKDFMYIWQGHWMGMKTFGQDRTVTINVFVNFRHNPNNGSGNLFIFVSILVEYASIEDLVQKLKNIIIRLEHMHRKVGYMYAQNQSFITFLDSKPV